MSGRKHKSFWEIYDHTVDAMMHRDLKNAQNRSTPRMSTHEKQDGTLAERLIHWHATSGMSYRIEARHIVHKPMPFLRDNYLIEFESNHSDPDVSTSFVFCTYTMAHSWKGYELLLRVYIPPHMVPKTSLAYERMSQMAAGGDLHDPELSEASVTFQLINSQKYINYKLVLGFSQAGKVHTKSDQYNNRPWFHEESARDGWVDIMKSVMRHNSIVVRDDE